MEKLLVVLISLSAVVIALLIGLIWLIRRKNNEVNPDKLMEELKTSFQSISFNTLKDQTSQGAQTLEEKKKLIDATLNNIEGELNRVKDVMNNFSRQTKSGFDVMAEKLESTSDTTRRLTETTENLRKVLSDPTARGQWGEKMAEDVLRLAGFIENVNYKKQNVQASGSKPDFTFLLPKGVVVNMDAKFPFTNYLKFIEAQGEADRQAYKKQFINDVKLKIKQVTDKDYINPEENTVDYVILFIPNEQVYSFINDTDRQLLDNAMKQKVIICSPLTLYAILAVIRQAMDNFNLAAKTNEVFKYMEEFKKQWAAFTESMEKMGRAIDASKKEYDGLTTTRSKQLDRVVNKMEDLKSRKELE